ncbi:MAG: response regulator transcription factor [Dehalococcoidales bacterium]|nr:response regulator transcription factor [Dehalococcoidales bacterium]
MTVAIKVIVVDGHELIRRGLRSILEAEENIEVVGECTTAEEVLLQVRRLSPNIVLMDVRLSEIDGIEATRRLKEQYRELDVIILAENSNRRSEAFTAGASAFLLKDDLSSAALAQTISQVFQDNPSLKDDKSLVSEVELTIPPTADAVQIMRFLSQLDEMLKESKSDVRQMVGSWDRGTVLAVELFNNPLPNFLDKLRNMPEVEKVEEVSTSTRSDFLSYLRRSGARRGLRPSSGANFQVVLKEVVA